MDRRLYEASLSGSVPLLNTLMQEDELILDRALVTCFHETPLHIAAMRGHLGLTQALLRRKPKLATELDSHGHSPLHLASAEGHVEIVRELLYINSDVCNARDQDGRTPLHLTAMKGQVGVIGELLQTIDYLLSIDKVKENANATNVNGSTALDVLDHCPRDVKVMEIREFLLEAGVQRSINGDGTLNLLISGGNSTSRGSCPNKTWRFVSAIWKKYLKNDSNWLEVGRGNLMVVATVTGTISFQARLDPPGSVWQDYNNSRNDTDPGLAVMDTTQPAEFKKFLKYNTVSIFSCFSERHSSNEPRVGFIMASGNATEALRDCVTCLEALVGAPQSDGAATLTEQMELFAIEL
ncbi:ankyrin repeat-containing protein At5g02620-like [Cornus florida]|uniref:ankyrin repeat-containing protein At5g02620-like n=1 Tax=Cornus florida TaxID=4283 RepID=UPI00289CB0BA|nr:ankyrin repeat-containing protein At5g02620-like [Cornus florida]